MRTIILSEKSWLTIYDLIVHQLEFEREKLNHLEKYDIEILQNIIDLEYLLLEIKK